MARSTSARRRGKPARSPLTNKQSLAAFCDWFLPGDAPFASLTLHGNTRWKPAALVWLALCWAWSEARNLTVNNFMMKDAAEAHGPVAQSSAAVAELEDWYNRRMKDITPTVEIDAEASE